MRAILALIIVMIALSGLGFAQEDNIVTATSALQDVLSTLQKSAEKLNTDNEQLAGKDKYFKGQIQALQAQLKGLEAQADLINKETSRYQGTNPHRAKVIARLEKENADLDQQLQNTAPPVNAGTQKEKLRLLKMIDESQQRQEALQQSILDYQKKTPLMRRSDALARQQLLKDQIKDIEDQLPVVMPQAIAKGSGLDEQWEDKRLVELGSDLKVLEKDYLQLRDLLGKMASRAPSAGETMNQIIEEQKLERSMEDIKQQSAGLRAELDDLRAQMVELDKRKSYLDMMIRQSP